MWALGWLFGSCFGHPINHSGTLSALRSEKSYVNVGSWSLFVVVVFGCWPCLCRVVVGTKIGKVMCECGRLVVDFLLLLPLRCVVAC